MQRDSKRVLIADPSSHRRKTIHRYLADFAQYKLDLDQAARGSQALQLVHHLAPHCVLLANDLPDSSGLDILAQIKRKPITHSPAVVITGNDDPYLRQQAFDNGATDYLPTRELTADRVRNSVCRALHQEQEIHNLLHVINELNSRILELENQASLDSLTGLPNRRVFFDTLAIESRRAARAKQPVTLILFEIDPLRGVDTEYKQPSNDVVCRFADCLKRHFQRAGDFVSRLNRQEFAVILPSTPEETAQLLAENLANLIAESYFNDTLKRFSFSAGVATNPQNWDYAGEALMAIAQETLQAAKRSRGNSVCLPSEAHFT